MENVKKSQPKEFLDTEKGDEGCTEGEIVENSKKNPPEEFLDTNEAAKFVCRSPGALRNLVMKGKVPYRKCHGRLAFVRDELINWILDSLGKSLEEIQQEEAEGVASM